MTLADDIRKDRETGTPGPWALCKVNDTMVLSTDGLEITEVSGDYNHPDTWTIMESNARRIARLPDLESAYLDIAEENKRLRLALIAARSDLHEIEVGDMSAFEAIDAINMALGDSHE